MVARSFHFDESHLRSFLDEDLPDGDQAQLSDHLEICPDCRRTLERLAAGSRLWGELHALRAGGSRLRSPGVAGSDPETTGTIAGRNTLGEPEFSLDFLAPSSTPGSLGQLGLYEVTQLLGRGGFGIVLKAFDPALGRAVAIKVLAPQLATSAAARSRFAREARAAAAVSHDHVVAIHAVDSWNGFPYLVMPFISGCSLQERVDQSGPMDVKSILRIGIQTAQGLAAAHAQGLVHRDVKPSNILLENGIERVKLTDFGLARAVDDASLTQSGVVAGTPQYMSPEQARGEPVDHRSDLFSLGSVFYTMCAGHPPFRAGSTPAVLRRVCDEQPRPIREVNSDIPIWLAELIDRLHAKDPAGRFQSATELADILERSLAALQRGLPIASIPSERVASAPRRIRRTSVAAVLAIAAVALLAVLPWPGKSLAVDYLFGSVRGAFASVVPVSSTGNGQDAQVTPANPKQPERIVGSGISASKTWDIADFSSVQVRSTFHARISKGSRFAVTTASDDNVLPLVRVVKEGNTLKIGLESNKSFELKKPLEAEITLPVLAGLDVSGAAEASLKGFDSEKELTLRLSGASKIAGEMSVVKADLDVDGASSLSLTGSAQSARLSGSGASQVTLPEFLMKECTLDLSGASTAQLSVRSAATFSAKLSGASELKGTVVAKNVKLDMSGASQATFGSTLPDENAKKTAPADSKSPGSSPNAASRNEIAHAPSSGGIVEKCDTAVIKVDDASQLNLEGLPTRTADIKLSGASHATINVTDKLTYAVSSASHLRCVGSPAARSGKKSGWSHVSID
jgi:eukaryotic-like serine/threonine-protein kinase